ncbi:PCI domain-containing protein 2 [Mortierella sp. AD032]|nr:PCI domain-containing protein 2 [Mortierella sp. AD032]
MIANIGKAGVKLEQYYMSQQVTHRYYLGRYALYQLDLRSAIRQLAFAFQNCPPLDSSDSESQANKITYKNSRLILIYLIAARICLGVFPSDRLLRHYELDIYFSTLIRAVKLGDLGLLDQHLDDPKGYIKGYIHSETKILVVGKTNPFPAISSVEVVVDRV